MRLNEDLHVHSTYSDGKDSLEENVRTARSRGLRRLGCVDHVRSDTGWLPEFVDHVQRLNSEQPIELLAGIEAKLLSEDGLLDLPADLAGVDLILAADHRLPWLGELITPGDARTGLRQGRLDGRQLALALAKAYEAAMERYPEQLLIAHPFSFLRQSGIDAALLRSEEISRLAHCARDTRTAFEVSERWRSPSPPILSRLQAEGVELVASTDSHRAATIGKYQWVRKALLS